MSRSAGRRGRLRRGWVPPCFHIGCSYGPAVFALVAGWIDWQRCPVAGDWRPGLRRL